MHILPDTTFQVEELAPGSRLFVWPTPRLKTVTVRLFFLSPLDGETTGRALVASVLGRGSRKFPTTRKIICFLQNLYGASLSLGVSKMGERHLLEASVELLADRYTARRGGILSRGIRFLREMLLRPLREGNGLRATYVDQEKRNLRRFLESLINDKAEYAAERHIEEMCRDEPFGQPAHGRIGEIDR